MEAKLVDIAQRRPGRCLASGDTEGPFIDAARWTREHDPYVYLSVRWVEEVARNLLGMVSKEDVEYRYGELTRQIEEQGKRIEAAERLAKATAEMEQAQAEVETTTAGELVMNGGSN